MCQTTFTKKKNVAKETCNNVSNVILRGNYFEHLYLYKASAGGVVEPSYQ